MADRGLITCYSQPVAKESLATISYEPPVVAVGSSQMITTNVNDVKNASYAIQPTTRGFNTTSDQVPKPKDVASAQYLYKPVNRGTPSNAGTLSGGSGTGTRVTQYWG